MFLLYYTSMFLEPYKREKEISLYILFFSYDRLKSLVFILPVIIIALSVHEFCHAYSAYLMGDTTAKEDGRLTLNPIKHIDPLGFIFIALFGFGWAKPVMFDDRNFKHKRINRVMTAMAGPFSNLIMGVASAFVLKYMAGNYSFMIKAQEVGIQQFIYYFMFYFSSINLGLFFFNMIPVPPLDGGHIIVSVFNLDYEKERLLARYGMMAILIIFSLGYIFDINLLPIHKLILYVFHLVGL